MASIVQSPASPEEKLEHANVENESNSNAIDTQLQDSAEEEKKIAVANVVPSSPVKRDSVVSASTTISEVRTGKTLGPPL